MVKNKPRNAFTLLELLVVIGILALLIGILAPTLSRARRQAKANACLQTIKHLGTGFALYLTENRDQFPPMRLRYWRPADAVENPTNRYVNEWNCREPRWQWFIKLDSGPPITPTARMREKTGGFGDDGEGRPNDKGGQTYTGDAYLCPSLDDPTWARDMRNGAYGYNYQYLGNSRQEKDPKRWDNFSVGLHLVKSPGGTVLLADSRGGGSKKHGVHSYTLDPPRLAVERNAIRFGPNSADATKDNLDPDPLLAFSPAEMRHDGKANVIFADTHGEAKSLKELGYHVREQDGVAIPVHDAADTTYTQWDNRQWTGTGRDLEAEKREPQTPEP